MRLFVNQMSGDDERGAGDSAVAAYAVNAHCARGIGINLNLLTLHIEDFVKALLVLSLQPFDSLREIGKYVTQNAEV